MKTYSITSLYHIAWALLLVLSFSACNGNKDNTNTFAEFSQGGGGNGQLKVGLVLGGGGAKASAEIGVLKRLEEMGIKVDCIAGSSMGAVVGSLYAAGYSPKEIEKMMLEKDWMKLFNREKILNKFPFVLETKSDQHYSNLGLVSRPYLQEELDKALSKKGCHLFEDFKIPFRCTATMVTYEEFTPLVCQEGVAATGVIASMSHPCFVFPWKHENKDLYDGGILNNLPVNLVRDMGADVIIAVDIENSKKIRTDEFVSLIKGKYPFAYQYVTEKLGMVSYGAPLLKWLEDRPDIDMRDQFIKESENDDSFIYIHVDLDDCSVADFKNESINKMRDRGYKAACNHQAELERVLN